MLDLVNRLRPFHPHEAWEWQELRDEFTSIAGSGQPGLFWYPSSGLDFKALVHFNERDTSEVYHSPTVDLFLYSDYSDWTSRLIDVWYQRLDHGEVPVFRDYKGRTKIWVTQIVPLRLFDPGEEARLLASRPRMYRFNSAMRDDPGLQPHFYYLNIRIWSDYFGEEYFPVLLGTLDNRTLMEEVLRPHGIRFDYICGVCDGCGKGGNYECLNSKVADYCSVLKEPGFWVSDHLGWRFPGDVMDSSFKTVATLRGWGEYNRGPDGRCSSQLHRVDRQALQRLAGKASGD
jgi:hypothetical protein